MEDVKPAPAKAKTAKVKYVGPPNQRAQVLAEHGYRTMLEQDMVYELPVKVAKALAASSRHFQPAE